MPQPITFQMAWLVAFNDNLFESCPPEQITARLTLLETQIKNSTLTIESPREHWVDAVSQWLNVSPKEESV